MHLYGLFLETVKHRRWWNWWPRFKVENWLICLLFSPKNERNICRMVIRKLATYAKPRQVRQEGKIKRRGRNLPPCLLQLIKRMQGVILRGAWAQDPVVLLRSCQPTFCTAVHHLFGETKVNALESGHGVKRATHRHPMKHSPTLTAFLPPTASEQEPRNHAVKKQDALKACGKST